MNTSATLNPFPVDVLEDARSALFLFGAGFYGANDAVWAQKAGVPQVTVVDLDTDKITAMQDTYPGHWSFAVGDAFEFAGMEQAIGTRYEVVSVDPFLGDCAARCREHLPTFLAITARALVLGIEYRKRLDAPAGWTTRRMRRSIRADWLILERA